jgi:hypothetical protein
MRTSSLVRRSLLTLVLLATGCGSATNHVGTGAPTTNATPTRTPSTTAQAGNPVGSAALTSTIDIDGTHIILSPPAPHAVSITTSGQAFASVQASGLYTPDLSSYSSSGMQFGLFTDVGYGPQPSAGQTFKPTYRNHPAWFIDYHNVPFVPSGSPGAVSASGVTTPPPATIKDDEFFIVNDTTGVVVMVINANPTTGATPMTVVPPPGTGVSTETTTDTGSTQTTTDS